VVGVVIVVVVVVVVVFSIAVVFALVSSLRGGIRPTAQLEGVRSSREDVAFGQLGKGWLP
jgi:hypothetical protein